jgi:single-strand DNA-binding protein
MGNLTRKPELRHTPAGLAVADLGVAVSDSYKNKAGEPVEATCFVDVVAWGRQAEACEQFLSKGAAVVVEGRLQFDQWQTDSGEKRSRLRVRADRVQFVGRGRGGEGGAKESPEPQEQTADEGAAREAVPF